MKNNKFFIAPFAAILILLFIFVGTQFPTTHSSLKNLPVGIVLEDRGGMGQTIVDIIQTNTQATEESVFEWEIIKSEKEMEEMFDNQELYGAIYIPKDFSDKYATFQTPNPLSAELKIYINQGKNANAATMVTQAFSKMIEQMNANVSIQLLTAAEENSMQLTVDQARTFTTPITSETIILNEAGTLTNAPLSLFQPVWIASIVSAILLWMAGRGRQFTSMADQLKLRGIQALIAVVLGFFAGYLLTWYTTWILGYEFTSFSNVALFLSITCTAFILLILAVIVWVGFAGLPIFILLMFFGLPLLQMVPEMMPSFYTDLIYPWLPFRFMVEGLREVLYFGGEVWNGAAVTLCWIAVVSAIVLLLRSGSKLKQGVVSGNK